MTLCRNKFHMIISTISLTQPATSTSAGKLVISYNVLHIYEIKKKFYKTIFYSIVSVPILSRLDSKTNVENLNDVTHVRLSAD